MAVFTADAADGSGRSFALVYATFLAFVAALWYSVRREDRRGHPEFVGVAGRYVISLVVAVVFVLASAFLPSEARLVVWAGVATGWILTFMLLARSGTAMSRGMPPTDSLVERFGLFTIVVLGKVIFGVVDGLSSPDRDWLTITTGIIALVIGFGFWWIYLISVAAVSPWNEGVQRVRWLLPVISRSPSPSRRRCGDGEPDQSCRQTNARRRAPHGAVRRVTIGLPR